MTNNLSSMSDGEAIYATDNPLLPVQACHELSFDDPVQNRKVALRVHVPEGPGPYPVIVFSHGSLCAAAAYQPLTSFWAARGFVVIAPLHLDALENPPSGGPPDLKQLLSSRVRDLSFVVDNLTEIAAAAAATDCIDTSRLAAAGHSFGALTALIKTGLALRPGEYVYGDTGADERFQAAISLSGVGPLPPMTDDAFEHISRPMLVTGGTLDEGNVGAGPVFPWEWRLSAYQLAPAGDKFSLALEAADHYFGGLIARDDKGGEPDPDGLATVAAVSTAFLNAYLRDQSGAREWLLNSDLAALTGGRAHWEYK